MHKRVTEFRVSTVIAETSFCLCEFWINGTFLWQCRLLHTLYTTYIVPESSLCLSDREQLNSEMVLYHCHNSHWYRELCHIKMVTTTPAGCPGTNYAGATETHGGTGGLIMTMCLGQGPGWPGLHHRSQHRMYDTDTRPRVLWCSLGLVSSARCLDVVRQTRTPGRNNYTNKLVKIRSNEDLAWPDRIGLRYLLGNYVRI